MSLHVFGNCITNLGIYSNNRGETQGNLSCLPTVYWKNNQKHITVSSESIRWAIRYFWQKSGLKINRIWDEEKLDNHRTLDKNKKPIYDPKIYIDDDVLGYMDLLKGQSKAIKRKSVLEIARAVSTSPAELVSKTFNSKSGIKPKTESKEPDKNKTILYSAELISTEFQYGFGITPEKLTDKNRIIPVIEAIFNINHVGGNHTRFLFDFSPASIVIRCSEVPIPQILYSFEKNTESGEINSPKLIELISSGEIDPSEIWLMGEYASTEEAVFLKNKGVRVFRSLKKGKEKLLKEISNIMDLK